MGKISKNFYVQEFVPEDIYKQYGENSTWFIRKDTVDIAQFIRDYFGRSMTINNWHKGGKYQERGYRKPDSKTGAKLSQHKVAGAIDFEIDGMTPDEVRSSILAASDRFLKANLTTLEHSDYAPTWVHADNRMTNMGKILIVKPLLTTQSDLTIDTIDTEEYFVWEKQTKELIKIKNYFF